MRGWRAEVGCWAQRDQAGKSGAACSEQGRRRSPFEDKSREAVV